MTYKELKENWNNKVLDYDGQWGGQCWDLAQYYFVKCLGVPSKVLGGCGYVNNMLKEPKLSLLLEYFDEVKTTEMLEGDTCIWVSSPHIAIYDHEDGGKAYFFSQNPNPCKVMSISGMGKFRAFRLKGSKPVEPVKPIEPKDEGIKIGDKVVPIKLVNWKGIPLKQYDDYYKVIGIDKRGAILGAYRQGGIQVWAVLSLDNIKKY